MDNGCGFFRWYDSSMCARSKKAIPSLLRRIHELESRVEDEMLEVDNFSESSVSSTRLREDEVRSRLVNSGKMKENVCWFFFGYFWYVCWMDFGEDYVKAWF